MKVIEWREDGEPREVELESTEEMAAEFFNKLLDTGLGIPFAAQLALNRYFPHVSASMPFVDWLSERTVYRRGQRYYVKPEWRTESNA